MKRDQKTWNLSLESRYITPDVQARAEGIKGYLTGKAACQGITIRDRGFWQVASLRLEQEELFRRVEQYIVEPLPVITEEIYMERQRGDKTLKADKILFSAMRRIEQATLAECLENKGRFLPYVIQGLESICQRKSLVRPGHDHAFNYCDYRGEHGLIDLYSSSLAWRLAEIDHVLEGHLPEALRGRVKAIIQEKVLDVFFLRLYEDPLEIAIDGMVPLYWLDGFDNWLSVCLSGVVCAGLYFDAPEKRALYIALYEKLMPNYLASLPNGDCVEGLAYWGYGFGKFIAASDLICRMTEGRIDLYRQPGFLQAAAFGRNSQISCDVYPSVSDCGFGTKPLAFCMDYLNLRESGNLVSLQQTKVDYSLDLNIAMMMLNFHPRQLSSLPPAVPAEMLRTWFENRSVLISRDPRRDLGVYIQGGHNHGPHNHNDVGSFIISAHGDTFVADPGFSVYDSTTFSPQRYTYEVLSSYGHSVPRVAGGGCRALKATKRLIRRAKASRKPVRMRTSCFRRRYWKRPLQRMRIASALI